MISGLKDETLFRQQCYIGGEWVGADDGAVVEVNNPATQQVIGSIPKLGTDETRRAVEAADAAWPAWRAKTAKERAGVLRRWYELMLENQEDLARIMTSEQGKPLAEAMGEVVYAASFLEWFAEEAKRIYGDVIPGHQADKRIVVLKQPVGVVASITPWNFPSASSPSPRPRRPIRPWPWPCWPSVPVCRRACSMWSPARPPPSVAR
jgi:succinate-semialdehyde dehydrogenase/glutarate-semialdehyde dehydrogenase